MWLKSTQTSSLRACGRKWEKPQEAPRKGQSEIQYTAKGEGSSYDALRT